MYRPVLALLFSLALLLGSVNPALAQTRPHYDIQISLNYADASLELSQRTTFRNDTGGELPEVVFQVTPAFFEAFTLWGVWVDGVEAGSSLDGTVLEIRPAVPLAPGATAQVDLAYRIQVPATSGRFGQGEGILALGNFYPVLAVHQGGWDRHQYVDVGDAFFTEAADYDVAVTSDRLVAIAAGSLPVREEGNSRHFHLEGVRDFAMAVSDRFQTRAREVDGIQVTAYGLSGPRLEVYLDAAEKTLRWYSANLGAYPLPSLTIAEMHDPRNVPIAQEYPGLIFLYSSLGADGGGPGSYSEYLTAHEIAHQWFYSQVGNDQVHDPWLDEAMTTYADFMFYRGSYPQLFEGLWQQRTVAAYRARVAAGGDRPVNTNIYDYPDDIPYFDMVYKKGAIFLDRLREMMGDEAFLALLRDYVSTFSGKVATPRAFLDMAYTRAGARFPELASRYFSYGAFSGGEGYQLEVEWPQSMVAGETASLAYWSSFPVAEAKVWLDSRLLYQGPGEWQAPLALEGVEAGEYVLRLDLLDAEGALYQRAVRVRVRG